MNYSAWLRTALAILLLPPAAYAQDTYTLDKTPRAATAISVEGTAFVTRPDGRQVLLPRGSLLQAGETINTTRNSSVRLRFTDGGETVVRPESSVQIQDYHFQQQTPEQDSLVMRLLRGGLRSVTGLVGKRGNLDAYKMQAQTVTVGIRGTDYSARICTLDCGTQSAGAVHNSSAPVAARVASLQGAALLRRGADPAVALTPDKPLYSGDEVLTTANAYVVLVFRDNTRVTINPNSHFALTQYTYAGAAKAPPDGMLVSLLKGGLRFATGLVGKVNPAAVHVRTVTATIGIRGTAFDLACAPTASSDRGSSSEMGDMPCDQSLFVLTREGTVTLRGDKGETIAIAAGQSGRVDGPSAPARTLDTPPEYFQSLTTPEPERVPADLDQLFGIKTAPQGEGIFVMVHEGRIEMAQEQGTVTLDAGESAFAGQAQVPVKLFSSPAAIDRDPFLSKNMFNENMCRR